jgi:hypothetical protein
MAGESTSLNSPSETGSKRRAKLVHSEFVLISEDRVCLRQSVTHVRELKRGEE